MSGIVGILHLDRAPVDQRLLRRMTDSMTFRGPDAQQIWTGGHVGLGHTLLKTTFEAEHEHQPFTLDGRVHIVADARVDAQSDLITKLEGRGHEIVPGTTDVELILRAYQVWGEDCVEHLLGDFAFAIWDGPRERLFCARDHMGVKPFYYAHMGQTLIFSNTLDCIRQHPAVSDKLNDNAVGDFLISGLNRHSEATFFMDIARLAAGHHLSAFSQSITVLRYWSLPVEERYNYGRAEEYVAHFRDLLENAVSDRLRQSTLGIFMSGGLDSAALASTAVKLQRTGGNGAVIAFTSVYDSLIPDRERFYADTLAKHLKIPIRFQVRDTSPFGWELDEPPIHTPEPVASPLELKARKQHNRETVESARVCFSGLGPDFSLQFDWKSHLSYLIRHREWSNLLRDVSHSTTPRAVVRLVRKSVNWKKAHRRMSPPELPEWISEDFLLRVCLRSRLDELSCMENFSAHPFRPGAYRALTSIVWPTAYENLNAGHTRFPLEMRYPFMDLRLVRFFLRIPPVPWCRSKHLLRVTLRGAIPEVVRQRPKTPLPGFPEFERARRSKVPESVPHPDIYRYVNWPLVSQDTNAGPQQFDVSLRAIGLNYWLNSLRQHAVERTSKRSSLSAQEHIMDQNTQDIANDKETTQKRIYTKPTMQVYGSLADLTASHTTGGAHDSSPPQGNFNPGTNRTA